MSGRLFLILSAVIAIFGVFSWNVINRMSIETIGMAIGMTLGVVAGIPTMALVFLARKRDDEDDYYPQVMPPNVVMDRQPAQTVNIFIVNARTPAVEPVVCQEDVTPYYNGMRRLLGDPPLPKRADLEQTALVKPQDPRRFIIRCNGVEMD